MHWTMIPFLIIIILLQTNYMIAFQQYRWIHGRYVSVAILNNNNSEDCIVTNAPYNAQGNGKTNTTDAIQRAIDDPNCGKIVIPSPGTFLIAALRLTRSNIEFHIQQGATLKISNERDKWPGTANIIQATNVSHVAITGGGTIDGQGLVWWQHREDFRPHMVQFTQVKNGILLDTLYLNAPNHVLELFCDNCELAHIKVFNPPSTGKACEHDNTCSHNTDAVDIHGTPFYVHNVNFTTGDDNIASHANHTLVEDSFFGTGHGASIGSLCGSYLTNITFRNITFHGTTCGARIKSHPKCSGHVWDVTYENLTMYNVNQAIDLTQFYDGTGPSTYLFERIVFKDVLVVGGRSAKFPSESGSNSDDDAMVDFDCDNHYDGKANCYVALDNLKFIGFNNNEENKITMSCKGVRGTTKKIDGINDCLKKE